MPAVSKAQQRFMGMVHAADKGETPASPEVAKVSADMKDSDAKDFASTSHDGLPDHVKEQLKSVVREVIREKSGMNEMSSNDVHFKHIMKLYDRGGSFTRKKIGAVICKDPKASRKDVEEELFDADYRDILEFEDELGLKEIREKYSSVKEDAAELPPATIPAAVKAKLQLAIDKIKDSKLSNNAKLQLLAQVIDAIGIDKSQLSTIASKIRSKMESVVTEEFKHVIHVDTPTQVVSKPVAAQIMALAKKGVRASEIGLEMGFVGNAKLAADTFQKVKNKIYFELDKRNESVNEAMGNDKSMLALVDILSNSMEHYSTESEFATVASKIAGFGKLKSLFKDVYNKYWDLGARERNDWHTKDWLNWLKKWSLEESVNEEHDCGCNENHDCGCGGLHEHHINEDLSADSNGIAGLTASRANAVKDFLEKNNINSNKLYLFLKKGNLKDRMDFVTALVGKPGNPIQKKVISQFSN